MNHLLFSLDADNKLVISLSKKLNLELSPIYISRFADGEWYVKPLTSVIGKKIFLFKSLSDSVNDNLIQLLIAIDSFKRAYAFEITLILPYYCYSRQDKKYETNDPISAKLVANLLKAAGASKVIFVDVHSDHVEGCFDIPVENIPATSHIVEQIRSSLSLENLVVVSPDYGGINRAKALGDILGVDVLIIEKHRPSINDSVSNLLFGNAKDKHCLIVDDMLDTGGTIIGAANLLKSNGASSVSIVVTHALFSGNALEKINRAWKDKLIEKIYVSDTLSRNFQDYSFIEVISIADLLANTVKKNMMNSKCISCT